MVVWGFGHRTGAERDINPHPTVFCATPISSDTLHCTALHCTALHCTVLQFHRSPGVTSAPHENFAVAEAVLKRAFLLGEPGGLRRGWRTLLLLGDSFCSGLDPSASAPPLRRNSLIDISRTLLGVDWSSSYFRLAGVAGGGAVRLP